MKEAFPIDFYNFVSDTSIELEKQISPRITQLMKGLLLIQDRVGYEQVGQQYYDYYDAINQFFIPIEPLSESQNDISTIELINHKRTLLKYLDQKEMDLINPDFVEIKVSKQICKFRTLLRKHNLTKF